MQLIEYQFLTTKGSAHTRGYGQLGSGIPPMPIARTPLYRRLRFFAGWLLFVLCRTLGDNIDGSKNTGDRLPFISLIFT